MSEAYANELENWFNSFPSIIQHPVRPLFDKMNEGLRWVAGNPQELARAGATYVQIGESVHAIANQQRSDVAALAGQWTGDAYQAFVAKMQDVEQKLDQLGDSIAKTKELLDAAAQAAVDGANMIIDIITATLSAMLAELAINGALAFFTFGASLAAMVAEWIADAVAALAQIMRVVGKVAQLLEKLYQLFTKLAETFRMLESFFRGLKELLAVLKSIKQGANGLKAKAAWTGVHAGAKLFAGKVIQGATVGNVSIPGMVGSGVHAGEDYWDAHQAANRAAEAAP
ncbi:MAG TPA: WXG100 family type VII secretion target [Micromonosporaceae bacterium]